MTAVSPGRDVVKVGEGSEPEDFWAALGGKGEYASNKWLAEELPSYPARLFQCSNASGKFTVEEIFDFAQDVIACYVGLVCMSLLAVAFRILLRKM